MFAWFTTYAVLLAVNWFGQNQRQEVPVPVAAYTKAVFQALLDASSPPAPSRVMGGHFVNGLGAFAPSTTSPGPSPLAFASSSSRLASAFDTTMVGFAAAMVLLFLLSSLWFLNRATIVGGAFAPTRANTSPPTESRWEVLSSVLCAWLIAKLATVEGELAAKAAAFSMQLAEQARAAAAAATDAANAAANAQMGLMAEVDYLTADIQEANYNAAAAKGQLASTRAAALVAAEEAAEENSNLLLRLYELAGHLNAAYRDKNAAAAANTAAAANLGRLQQLHEALQASYATTMRDANILRQQVDFYRRQGGAAPGFAPHQQAQQQQHFGPGFRPQQQQQRGRGGPYAPNPGAAFGQYPRRQ